MQAIITSRTNARVKALRAAFEGRTGGIAAIEGEHLLLEALRSNVQLQTVYLSEDARSFDLPIGTEIVYLANDIFQSIAATENTQGIAATIAIPLHGLPTDPTLLLVADNLRDPGNMGTLIRSAEAFGVHALLTTAGTVDPWNQKSIRASAGSIFRLPIVPTTVASLLQLKASGIRLFAAVVHDARPAVTLDLSRPTAIIIGNEGSGISRQILDLADERITIPCPGQVESLNAAIAGSLLLYEASRQRSAVRNQ